MKVLCSLVFLMTVYLGSAQDSLKVVQFSGRVIAMDGAKIDRLMYTNIAVQGTARGAVTDIDGFFSLAVREGESVLFSHIGYEQKKFTIPTIENGNMFSKDIILSRDTVFLNDVFIYPWPDKDYFKIEFLALEVDQTLEELAAENISEEKIQILRELMPVDGGEVSKMELRQAAESYYYSGQLRPQNIFNPLSWKKFIDAIKRGDYKKKDK